MATFGFTHLLKAAHAGTVYSSSCMKINCASTRFYPNVAAYTSKVVLYRHYLGWATEIWITADEEMQRKTKKGLYVSTAYVVFLAVRKAMTRMLVMLFSHISGRWPGITVTVLGCKNNAVNSVMSLHPLLVAMVSPMSIKLEILVLKMLFFEL